MKKVWEFELEDGKHTVTLEYLWSSERIIRLDGKVVVDEMPINNLGFKYSFDCAGHKCEVQRIKHFFSFKSDEYVFTVDDQPIIEKTGNT